MKTPYTQPNDRDSFDLTYFSNAQNYKLRVVACLIQSRQQIGHFNSASMSLRSAKERKFSRHSSPAGKIFMTTTLFSSLLSLKHCLPFLLSILRSKEIIFCVMNDSNTKFTSKFAQVGWIDVIWTITCQLNFL